MAIDLTGSLSKEEAQSIENGPSESVFELIEPGYYTAFLDGGGEYGYYNSRGITYLKVRPNFVIMKEDGTPVTHNRQDITLGCVTAKLEEGGKLYAHPKSKSGSLFFTDARFFLQTAGLLWTEADGTTKLELNPVAMNGQVFRVKVDNESYQKGVAKTIAELEELFEREDAPDTLVIDEDGVQVQMALGQILAERPMGTVTVYETRNKNVLKGFYPMRPSDASEEWNYDELHKVYFRDEALHSTFIDVVGGNAGAPDEAEDEEKFV
jgi:hypothetical protein